jgi:hypothetical protein
LPKRAKAIPEWSCLVKATQIVLQRDPHRIRLIHLSAGGEPLGKLADDLVADIQSAKTVRNPFEMLRTSRLTVR